MVAIERGRGPYRAQMRARLALLWFLVVPAKCWADSSWWDELDKSERVTWLNVAGVSFITLWGIKNWDYGDRSPHAEREGWFGEDTKSGGADKLGHMFTTYALSHGLSWTYEDWGYGANDAARLGAWSSFGLMSFMEFGDAFSEFGFSYEDFIMNALGSYVGYVMYTQPRLREVLDLRLEYQIKFTTDDIFTDYERMKYVAAIKFDGIAPLKNTYARYFDFQVGYFTRGYENANIADERNVYVALGLNLSHLFNAYDHKKTATFFNYVQLPKTYVDSSKNLND